MNTATILTFSIYLLGMLSGFILAAFTKGNWWGEPCTTFDCSTCWLKGKSHPVENNYIALLIIIFWWAAIAFLVLNVFISCIEVVVKRLFNALDKTNLYFQKLKSSTNKIKKIAVPSPLVRESYREAGPKPCVACGTPTSLVQEEEPPSSKIPLSFITL